MADRTARFSNWFQIISNVAIIIGLGLVVYELNQSKQLAHVQFINDDFARMTNIQIALMGENPQETLAKAALRPAELTEADTVILDAFYFSETMNWVNHRISSIRGGLERPWREHVDMQARIVFSSPPGREWLRAWAARIEDDGVGQLRRDIADIALEAVRNEPNNYYRANYELLLAANK